MEDLKANVESINCYSCKHLLDVFGNYIECGLSADEGRHMFVDWYYWHGKGRPDKCPLANSSNLESFNS